MSVQLIIELSHEEGIDAVLGALEMRKRRLRDSIMRTKRRLDEPEKAHGVTTSYFLNNMTAEDLAGGDMEYVEWAGEAALLKGLEDELAELEHANYQLP